MELSFIIIDDTELDHFIARKMITNANSAFKVNSFLDAQQALNYIIANDMDTSIKVILIFLDIYMPLMNGFEFVEEFEKLDQAIKDKYYIVALTSTIEMSDINRISSYQDVREKITKPLMADDIRVLINRIATTFNLTVN
ncbi:response regulator [Mucilaginibacter antarcticus]|uniref:Response regulator n=1 Tax=Mucilaginibacter antarcticus TaxID=1855725 RepID=A0ABW5XRK9_9SPHI